MKKLILLIPLLVSCCPQTPKYHHVEGFALGTTYSITASLTDTTGLHTSISNVLHEAEHSMSLYDSSSLLSRLNRNETDSIDRHIAHCIAIATQVGKISGGAYDITLRPVVDAWGFNENIPQTTNPNLDSLMQFVGQEKIRVVNNRLIKSDPRVQIDLNSIAKGYAVDLLAELMASRGAENFMLEVGGEIVCRGSRKGGGAWRIGIDKPLWGNITPGAHQQGIISLHNGAMATSGNYRRFRLSADSIAIVHTIDGRTGQAQATDILSASVIASTCAEADAWATMLMAVGSMRAREILFQNPGIEAYLILADGETLVINQTSSELNR